MGEKAPLVVRLLAGMVVAAVYGGLSGFLIVRGILDHNPVIWIMEAVIFLLGVLAFAKSLRRRRQ